MQKNALRRCLHCMMAAVLLLFLVSCERTPTPTPDSDANPEIVAVSAPALLDQALKQRDIGADDQAALDLRRLLDTYPESSEARLARYYLAESFARRGRWSSANVAFEVFLNADEQDELTARALFWLARGYEEIGDASAAAATYARYREFDTILEPYAAMRQAAQLQALGQIAEAAQLYEHSATADISPGERAGSYEKAIALHRQLGQDDIALQRYVELLDLATQPAYRARLLSEAAALAQAQGQTDQARAWLLEITAQHPELPAAAEAAAQLVAAGDPALAPATAARILYIHGRYDAALPLFDEALIQVLGNNPDAGQTDEVLELQRQRAMTLRERGSFPEALDALAAVSSTRPDSEPGRQARLDWIQTVGQSGETEQAIDAYREYADIYRDDPRAPMALDRAAQLLQRLENTDAAMQTWVELGERYPESELAPLALHRAGMHYYLAGRWPEALMAWQHLTRSPEAYEQARGAFWGARTAQQQQDAQEARGLFELAVAADPDSYYGARAADELALDQQPDHAIGAPISEESWHELEQWIATWADQPVHNVVEEGYDPAIADSGFVQRARELEQVGLGHEAIGEWNSARDIWAEEPNGLMQIARLAHTADVPYIGLKTAEQLAALAPDDAPPPDALRRLIYPVPYPELVITETAEQEVDPRLVYALLRQESLFNPDATSWVGARGLAQVMPTTGEGIAQRLDVPDFQTSDLYRPHVSLRFGTFYIDQQIQNMNGSVFAGLAAYNGGLGNALRWAGGDTVADPDLFVETIDYAETRNYVKLVYGYYGAYRELYELP